MKNILAAAVIAASAVPALADSDRFGGFAASSAGSVSGFVNAGQHGDWSVGAMNESYGFAGVTETHTGVELSTSGGSVTEGFGSNFRGFTGAGGAGSGFGAFGFRGRF